MKGKKPIIIIISIIAAVFIVSIVGVNAYNNAPHQRAQVQIDLGNQYLSDLNYEEAAASFILAIQIEPSNNEALEGVENTYVAWGQSYIDKKEYSEAESVLTEGLSALASLQTDYGVNTDAATAHLTSLKDSATAAREQAEEEAARQKAEEEARKKAEQEAAEEEKRKEEALTELEDYTQRYQTDPTYILAEDDFEHIQELLAIVMEEGSDRYINEEAGFGFYQTEDGIFLYLGQFDNGSRTGEATWIFIGQNQEEDSEGNEQEEGESEAGNGSYYYAVCSWSNDLPEGDFTSYDGFATLDENPVMEVDSGTVTNGLYDGDITVTFTESNHTYYVNFTKGLVNPVEDGYDSENPEYPYRISQNGIQTGDSEEDILYLYCGEEDLHTPQGIRGIVKGS